MDIAFGRVSEDPLHDLPVGSIIKFDLVNFSNSDATSVAQFIGNWRFFQGTILAVGFKYKESHEILSTAVIIAPGIALTATHIFDGKISKIQSGDLCLYCYGIRESGIEIWKVTWISTTHEDDIAILSIEAQSPLPENKTYYRLRVTTRAPKNGESLHIVGFRQEAPTLLEAPKDWRLRLYASKGSVAAVYPSGRDKHLLPYPVIELNCGSLGGMSGGAAFDSHGWLVGIISRGLTTLDGDGPTYLSWAIQALHRSVDPSWPGGVYPRSVRLFDLDRSLLVLERPEALTVDENQWSYEIWFDREDGNGQ